MAECKNKEKNLKGCTCTYEPCERKGVCCDCVRFHARMKELPACFFNKQGEASYDRSMACFMKEHF